MAHPQGALQEALQNMDDSALTVDQLDALSRAVPDDTERKDIKLYLKVAILPHLGPLLLCLEVAPACLQLGPCRLLPNRLILAETVGVPPEAEPAGPDLWQFSC